MNTLVAIAIGAVLGAWSRWWIGLKLNGIYPDLPLGTLFVNLIGGFIIGLAVAYFAQANLPPQYKLFLITGFCGALTTFSTFSTEILALLQQGRLAIACGWVLVHVVGSIGCTFFGLSLGQYVLK